MGSGDLDQLITLQARTGAPDGIGGTLYTWGNLASNAAVWAAVEAQRGRESMTEGRITAVFPVTFTIYHRDDLSEVNRILWNGEAYNIRNIQRTGGRRLMKIDAERGVAS